MLTTALSKTAAPTDTPSHKEQLCAARKEKKDQGDTSGIYIGDHRQRKYKDKKFAPFLIPYAVDPDHEQREQKRRVHHKYDLKMDEGCRTKRIKNAAEYTRRVFDFIFFQISVHRACDGDHF